MGVFDNQYKYSDFTQGDYLSSYTLTNIIDGSWGEGAAADLTNIVANCLITTGALKKGNIDCLPVSNVILIHVGVILTYRFEN